MGHDETDGWIFTEAGHRWLDSLVEDINAYGERVERRRYRRTGHNEGFFRVKCGHECESTFLMGRKVPENWCYWRRKDANDQLYNWEWTVWQSAKGAPPWSPGRR